STGEEGAFVPGGHVGASVGRALNLPLVVQLHANHDARLGVRVKGEQQGMTAHVVVRCKLRFDVRAGDPAPDAHDHSLRDPGDVHVEVNFRGVPAVERVVFQQLIAEPAPGREVTVVDAIIPGDAEPVVDVVGLYRVQLALQTEKDLVHVEFVRAD